MIARPTQRKELVANLLPMVGKTLKKIAVSRDCEYINFFFTDNSRFTLKIHYYENCLDISDVYEAVFEKAKQEKLRQKCNEDYEKGGKYFNQLQPDRDCDEALISRGLITKRAIPKKQKYANHGVAVAKPDTVIEPDGEVNNKELQDLVRDPSCEYRHVANGMFKLDTNLALVLKNNKRNTLRAYNICFTTGGLMEDPTLRDENFLSVFATCPEDAIIKWAKHFRMLDSYLDVAGRTYWGWRIKVRLKDNNPRRVIVNGKSYVRESYYEEVEEAYSSPKQNRPKIR